MFVTSVDLLGVLFCLVFIVLFRLLLICLVYFGWVWLVGLTWLVCVRNELRLADLLCLFCWCLHGG